MQQKRRSFCGISTALEIFGDKWSLLVVRDLMFRGKHTFKDFLTSDEGIATNILADRLARLEEQGIVFKARHPDSKSMNLYCLTEKGIDLMPILFEIIVWSDKHSTISEKGQDLARKIRADRQRVAEAFREKLKAVENARPR